ncbi:rRNA or tRNA methylase [Corynebacterium xerosis]|uniref:rRNA or tRNA methylase n=1 Tax=Corynebacterium xerosis TaxID=1725 RepID=A0A2N6SWU8_9CORY|nr:methyltransferase [Corynebacterium xerosis]PMC61496.1 rRNA or tRNA methylase [Corynebacterium xerosis]
MSTNPIPTPPSDAELFGLPALAPRLADALRGLGYGVGGLRSLLGDDGLAALDRGEPEAVVRTIQLALDRPGLAAMITAFIVGDPVDLVPWLGAELVADSLACGVLRESDGRHVAAIDVRPVGVDGIERLVFSDRDASMTDHVPGPDHVLGVGRASRSLLDITPTDPVGTVLDLGAGCGVQALGQHRAASIVATDVHPRACVYAEATLAAAGLRGRSGDAGTAPVAEVIEGSWFQPVTGRRFDRIVANPPFVVGVPEVGHVYRDSGLDLDGATELMLREVPDHLEPDGTAHLLGAWAHHDGGDWATRVASWLPKEGVEAWIIQRDVVDPAAYVGTWLRDESIDPRGPEGREKTRRWLNHFAANDVAGIGFGYVTIQRIDGPSSITCEDMPQPLGGPFRDEAAEWLLRSAWLRDKDVEEILAGAYRVRPGVAVERVELAGTGDDPEQGFSPAALRVTRTDGPRWSHDTDDAIVRILSALHPDAALSTVLDVMAMLGALPEDGLDEIKEAVVPIIVDLVRHGLVLPAELIGAEHGTGDTDQGGLDKTDTDLNETKTEGTR